MSDTERLFDMDMAIERSMHDDALDMWRERHERDCNADAMSPSVDVYVPVMSSEGE